MPKTKEEMRAYNRDAQRRYRLEHKAQKPIVSPSEWEYVYLFRRPGLYKIGRTANIEARRYGLASMYRTDVAVVHSVYVRYPRLVEMEWSWRFRRQRSNAEHPSRRIGATEWFSLSDQDVAWICSQQGDEVLRAKYTMTLNEAIEYLQQESAQIDFLSVFGVPRVRIHLPIWTGYYVERNTITEATSVVKERCEEG